MIFILNRLDLILTMLTEEMNATIGPRGCGKSTTGYGALEVLRILLMIPLNMEVEGLLLSKLLSTGSALVRKVSAMLLQVIMHSVLLFLRNDLPTELADEITICVSLILYAH